MGLFGSKNPEKKAEELYKKGLAFVRSQRFRDAVSVLEEAAKMNPVSAPINQVLAYSYSQIAADYSNDENVMNSWINKAAETFWKAVILHREHGGLEQKQLTTAMDMVAAVDRINIEKSNNPPEEKRKKIFLEYKLIRESGFDLFAAAGDIMRGNNLSDMAGSLQKHSSNAQEKAIERVIKTFNLTERQVRAIIQEAENKKW